jgi:hypothetical protein
MADLMLQYINYGHHVNGPQNEHDGCDGHLFNDHYVHSSYNEHKRDGHHVNGP